MRTWLASLVHGRIPEIALALAAGYAAVTFAESTAGVATNVLAQHFGRTPFGDEGVGDLDNLFSSPYYLNFNIGGTLILYGQVVSAALTLGLVALGAVLVLRRRERELGICPFCASRIPYASAHCAYYGSSVSPGKP